MLAALPATCDLDITADRWSEGAALLRRQPELVGELRWHLAAVATFLFNMSKVDQRTRELNNAISAVDHARAP